MCGTRRSILTAVCMLLGMFSLSGSKARADAIDLAMLRDAKVISQAVRNLGAEFVTVLKFEVQTANLPPSFEAGLANVKMAQKLENLLLLANDANEPLFILTGASPKIAQLPSGTTWRTPEGRKNLASISGLALSWDTRQTNMTPELFVTGQLKVDPKAKSAKVTLYAFTRKDPSQLKEIYSTSGSVESGAGAAVPVDRSVLSLAGMSYAVDRSVQNPADANQAAVQQVTTQLSKPMEFEELLGHSPIKLDIFLNNQLATPKNDPLMPGGGRIGTKIKTGDKIEFRLTNVGKKTYAVVLAVNGRNTNSLGRDHHLNALDPKNQRKWLLAPGEQAMVQGFYVDQKGQYRPFEILSDSTSATLFSSLSENYRGLVTMHVFGEKRESEPVATTDTSTLPLKSTAEEIASKKAEQEATVVTLGIGGSALEEVRLSGNLEVAKAKIQNLTNVTQTNGSYRVDPGKVSNLERGLIVESESIKSGSAIEKVQFPIDANPVAFVQVRYYDR